MADETEDQQNKQEEPVQSTGPSTSISVATQVAEQIKGSGPQVTTIVVNQLVDAEVQRRSALIIKGLSKVDELDKAFKQINKPDVTNYTTPGDNTTAVNSYSSERSKKIVEDKLKLTTLRNKLDAALDKNDADSYASLAKLIG